MMLFKVLCVPHLNELQDGVHNGLLVLKPALFSQHVGQEVHEGAVLLGELEAQGADGLHHHDLEIICAGGDMGELKG